MKLFINAKITYRTRIKLVVWLIKGCADNVTVTGVESGIDKLCSNSSLVLGFHFHTNDLGERHDSISSASRFGELTGLLGASQSMRRKSLNSKSWRKRKKTILLSWKFIDYKEKEAVESHGRPVLKWHGIVRSENGNFPFFENVHCMVFDRLVLLWCNMTILILNARCC